jgi:hypothetical protein
VEENLMKMFRLVLTIVVMAAIAVGAQADEQKGKRKGKRQANAPSATKWLVSKLELTVEQKNGIAAIDNQFVGKLQELQKKQASVLTDEQNKVRQETTKANRAANKKGPDARKAVQAAMKLSDAQQAQWKEIQKARSAVTREVRAALQKVLTAEQLEKLPKPARGAGAKKRKGKKSKNDK